MTLAQLKSRLQTLTGTSILQVFFDWKIYSDESRSRLFPCVVWNLDGVETTEDCRSNIIQQYQDYSKISVFAINAVGSDFDKITEWDTLKGYLKTYLNAMNDLPDVQIFNIDKLKLQYLGESVDKGETAIGIVCENIQLRAYCPYVAPVAAPVDVDSTTVSVDDPNVSVDD